MSLQEKFQITVPPKIHHEKDNEWATFKSARDTGDAGMLHETNSNIEQVAGGKFNQPPPGMEIANQRRSRIPHAAFTIAGETDQSHDANPQAFAEGFTRKNMKGTDDQYTGEHMDHFYGEVVDEEDHSKVGFAERNNYLDRE